MFVTKFKKNLSAHKYQILPLIAMFYFSERSVLLRYDLKYSP
jgi:hypothetical protein